MSRRTYAKIRQGLFWAFAYNVIGIPLAAFGYLSPVLAGAAMASQLRQRGRQRAHAAGLEAGQIEAGALGPSQHLDQML